MKFKNVYKKKRENRDSLSNTGLLRTFNTISVLRTIYKEGTCSRTQLTKATNISPATVTNIVAELLKEDIIKDVGHDKSTGGRRPEIFQLNYDKLFIVGIYMRSNCVDMVLADIKAKVVIKKSYQPYSLLPRDFLNELAGKFELLLKNSGINKEHVLGVGLAVSGFVDSDGGIIVRSGNLGWRLVNIAEDLEEKINIPILVENDANAAVLAEYWFGRAKEMPSVLYIKTDSGVGAGIIYERTLLSGSQNMTGEIGHVPLIKGGPRCKRCGQEGCLETYLYLPDVIERYAERTGEFLDDNEFFEKYHKGDIAVGKLVEEAADALATAVIFVGGLLGVDMIIIGGRWGALGEGFIDIIRKRYHDFLENSQLPKKTVITGSTFTEECDLLGAVGLVIDRWFTLRI